ncbi:uncharacterized protein LOC121874862 [Homarus americanus]|nr:uncharacterized protein LOC121874862 [Homarus americanus]
MVNGESFYVDPGLDLQPVVTSGGNHEVLVFRYLGCIVIIGSSKLVIMQCTHVLFVWAPSEYSGLLNGLCGHLSNNKKDDFLDRWEDLHPYSYHPIQFALSWMTEDQLGPPCNEMCPEPGYNCSTTARSSDKSERLISHGKKPKSKIQKISKRIRKLCRRHVGKDPIFFKFCVFDLWQLYKEGKRNMWKEWVRKLCKITIIMNHLLELVK